MVKFRALPQGRLAGLPASLRGKGVVPFDIRYLWLMDQLADRRPYVPAQMGQSAGKAVLRVWALGSALRARYGSYRLVLVSAEGNVAGFD